jgi:hypothetical protein
MSGDETFYVKHPEFLNPSSTPSAKNRTLESLYLVRFGPEPKSREQLALDAAKSLASNYSYGVSTFLRRKPGSNARSAPLLEVMQRFQIKKTGQADHFTVILPNPGTQKAANDFNSLFIKR